jgi:hypothetical protein
MKRILLITLISVSLLFFTNRMQAQTTQTKLSQVELMKQYVGTWKAQIAIDTAMIFDITPFGNAYEGNLNWIVKGQIINSGKWLWGYDKKRDKFIVEELWKYIDPVRIDAYWFTSDNTAESVPLYNISNPELSSSKAKLEIKSPDLIIHYFLRDNKVVRTFTYTREKK